MLLYALVCGAVPFRGHSMRELSKKILKGDLKFPEQPPGKDNKIFTENTSVISADYKNLVKEMLCTSPNHRISLPEILNHPWMNADAYPKA